MSNRVAVFTGLHYPSGEQIGEVHVLVSQVFSFHATPFPWGGTYIYSAASDRRFQMVAESSEEVARRLGLSYTTASMGLEKPSE